LSAVVSTNTNINIEKTVVPIYRPVYGYSQFRIGGMESRLFYFSTGSNLKQGSNDDVEGDDDKSSSSSNEAQSPFSSPLAGGNAKADNTRSVPRKSSKKFVPRKAAVKLSEKARTLFQKLLENHPTRDGILLDYKQSSTGQPRMVFSFSFVSKDELHERDKAFPWKSTKMVIQNPQRKRSMMGCQNCTFTTTPFSKSWDQPSMLIQKT